MNFVMKEHELLIYINKSYNYLISLIIVDT